MAATESVMLELGTKLPNFNLVDVVTEQNIGPDYLNKNANVVMFICNHCPYVKYINKELANIYNDYISEDVAIVAISSNEIENYPEDSPGNMRLNALEQGFRFPYLFDETQEVAKAFKAACTPDFFVFDENQLLVYRGQLDNSRPNNLLPITGKDLRNAIDSLLQGKKPDVNQIPSIGCNIKWKE